MIEKYLLKEQKPGTNIETTPKDQGQFGGGIGGGSTEKNKDKEASQEDISKLTEAAFAEDIKAVANKSPKSLKISPQNGAGARPTNSITLIPFKAIFHQLFIIDHLNIPFL
jgi:hypothetical protein